MQRPTPSKSEQNNGKEGIGDEHAVEVLACLISIVRAVQEQPGVDGAKLLSGILRNLESRSETTTGTKAIVGPFRQAIRVLSS